MIQLINAGTTNIENANLSIDPYDTDTQTSDALAFTDADSPVGIPAGKYYVRIFNEGFPDITVNGQPLPSGDTREFHAFSNPATQELDLTPAITITVPSGGKGSYYWTGPSA